MFLLALIDNLPKKKYLVLKFLMWRLESVLVPEWTRAAHLGQI